jgi:hypothetical protein
MMRDSYQALSSTAFGIGETRQCTAEPRKARLATFKMQPGQKCGTGSKKSLPILIRVLDQVKLRIRSTPS